MRGASHTEPAISFQSVCKELGIVPGACDPSSTVAQTISGNWTMACMASVYCDKEKKRFKTSPRLKCNVTKMVPQTSGET